MTHHISHGALEASSALSDKFLTANPLYKDTYPEGTPEGKAKRLAFAASNWQAVQDYRPEPSVSIIKQDGAFQLFGEDDELPDDLVDADEAVEGEEAFTDNVIQFRRPVEPARRGPVRFSDLMARIVPPVRELIPGLLERHTVTFLNAGGGVGKSFLALQWALCLDAGAPVFGQRVERCSVIYLSYEDHADEIARRAQRITRKLDLPSDSKALLVDCVSESAPLAIVSEAGIQETEHAAGLRALARSVPGHKLIILDSCYDAMQFLGNAKINEGSVKGAISWLQRLALELDATFLVLWHPSVAGAKAGDASGWSVAWHNAPRAKLSLTVEDEKRSDVVTLKVEKRNHAAKGATTTLYRVEGGVLVTRSAMATAEAEKLLYAVVRDAAIAAAVAGSPVKRQGRIYKAVKNDIEAQSGQCPTDDEIREILERAVLAGHLEYRMGRSHGRAGYYQRVWEEEF